MIIKPLPSWALINRFPSFYDSESLTSVEQTARVYGKMQELIESYNKYVETINSELMEFEAEHDKDYNCFIKTIIKLTSDYISTVDLKLNHMNRTLAENYEAFTDNVLGTITQMVVELKESGKLDAALLDAVDGLNTKLNELNAEMNGFKTYVTAQQTAFENSMTEQQTAFENSMTEQQNNFVTSMDAKFTGFSTAAGVAIEKGKNDSIAYTDGVFSQMDDFIIDRTINSGVVIERYNSGIIRLYGSVETGVSIVGGNTGSVSVEFPAILTSVYSIIPHATVYSMNNILSCNLGLFDTDGFDMYVTNNGSNQASNITVHYHVVGLWKEYTGKNVL